MTEDPLPSRLNNVAMTWDNPVEIPLIDPRNGLAELATIRRGRKVPKKPFLPDASISGSRHS